MKLYIHRNHVNYHEDMYKKIKDNLDSGIKQYIIVPDQFTLEAEKIALDQLQVDGLIDIEILSFSRMCMRILEETGGNSKTIINKQGKHMILLKILAELKDELDIFSKSKDKRGFIEMLNDFITDIKQSKISIDELESLIGTVEEDVILHKKLKDVLMIYKSYEKHMANHYIDNEDYYQIVYNHFLESTLIKDAIVWIEGFDYFSLQMLDMIEKILQQARETNIVLLGDREDARDADVFDITKFTVGQCQKTAEKVESQCEIQFITSPVLEKNHELKNIESELFSYPYNTSEEINENITLTATTDYYAEIETIASKIIELTREKDYRYRDIIVICNDTNDYNSVIKKVFGEHQIPYFIDEKKNIMHNPLIEYITALLDTIHHNYKYEDIFRLIKTNMTDISYRDYEKIENYVLKYGIRGASWREEFYLGKEQLEEELEEINKTREKIIALINGIETKIEKAKTAKEKTEVLYHHLAEELNVGEKLEKIVDIQNTYEAQGYIREATQIWQVVSEALDQIVELLGDQKISRKQYAELVSAGFEAVEIGIIPTTNDQIVVGTIQRSRSSSPRAVFIVGLNDGVIPSAMTESGILGDQEKERLKEIEVEIGRHSHFRIKEEKLNIYKSFTTAKDAMYLSYVNANTEGKEIKPSLLVDRIKKLYPNLKTEKDIHSMADHHGLLSNPNASLKFLINGAKRMVETGDSSELWESTYNWYLKNPKYSELIKTIQIGLFYDNQVAPLSKKLSSKIYQNPFVASASRLELYASCPFAHFVKYGLGAKERKVREVQAAEFGFIFHEALMQFGEEIERRNISWQSLTQTETNQIIDDIINNIAKDFDEGILHTNHQNLFKLNRIKGAVKKTAWILTEHISRGQFDKFKFETDFGQNKEFPAIELELADGEKAYLEGRIDRIDLIQEENETIVKVIDYKSGGKTINLKDIVNGFQLQLILYLNATMNGLKKKRDDASIIPAGVFYLKVDNPMLKSEDGVLDRFLVKEEVEKQIRKKFMMEGLIINDMEIIEKIDSKIAEESSVILNIKRTKKGFRKGTKVYSKESFKKISNYVNDFATNICSEIIAGKIKIEPKKIKSQISSCTYCDYKSICQFDLSFPNNKLKTMKNEIDIDE